MQLVEVFEEHGAARGVPDVTLDRAAFERSMRSLHWPLRWFNTQTVGFEKLPSGAALLIGNHGPLGVDAPLFMASVFEKTGRPVRGLLDRIWLSSAWSRALTRQVGCLLADRATALAALAQGDLVLNYPGGVPEAMRSHRERYTLKWEARYGFVKVALLAGVPVVPVACIGMDDLLFQLLDHDDMKQTPWGRMVGDRYGARYVPPLMLGPLPGEVEYLIGDPIALAFSPKDADKPEVLARCQRQVKGALETLIQTGLARKDARKSAWRERGRNMVIPVLARARKELTERLGAGA